MNDLETQQISQKRSHYYSKKYNRFFNSIKCNAVFRPDSYLETCFMRELEFQTDVEIYKAQPKSYIYKYKGELSRYTPDFLIKYIDGSHEFIELKISHRFDNEKFNHRFSILKEFFLDRYNIPLVASRNTDIDNGFKIENLFKLYNYKKFDLKPFNLQKIKDSLSNINCLGELYAAVGNFNCSNALAPALIAQNIVKTDLSLKFSPKNFAEINNG
jgi:hypothetical protein